MALGIKVYVKILADIVLTIGVEQNSLVKGRKGNGCRSSAFRDACVGITVCLLNPLTRTHW